MSRTLLALAALGALVYAATSKKSGNGNGSMPAPGKVVESGTIESKNGPFEWKVESPASNSYVAYWKTSANNEWVPLRVVPTDQTTPIAAFRTTEMAINALKNAAGEWLNPGVVIYEIPRNTQSGPVVVRVIHDLPGQYAMAYATGPNQDFVPVRYGLNPNAMHEEFYGLEDVWLAIKNYFPSA